MAITEGHILVKGEADVLIEEGFRRQTFDAHIFPVFVDVFKIELLGRHAESGGQDDEWFDAFVYQAVVKKSLLPKELVKELSKKKTVLNPWDPMGTLAD